MEEEKKIRAEGKVNTGNEETEKSTKQIVNEEIEQFKKYIDGYIPGVDSKIVDEYLDYEDYVKMIVTRLYDQYVMLLMQQQQQQANKELSEEQGNSPQKF